MTLENEFDSKKISNFNNHLQSSNKYGANSNEKENLTFFLNLFLPQFPLFRTMGTSR